MRKQVVFTDKAPQPVGAYNQAIWGGETLYISGQIGIDPQNNQMVSGDVEREVNQVMNNLKAILGEAGLNLSKVVKTTIYMTDLTRFPEVNEIYGNYFGESAPARECVEVQRLPKDANLKISMVAINTD